MTEAAGLPVTPDLAELRFAGEDILDRIELGETRVLVTSHRVLVLTPDGPGARFRAVDRPNVVAVGQELRADRRAGRYALQAGLYAVVLSAAGALINLDSLVAGVDLTGIEGLGGASAAIDRLLGLLALLDDAMLVAGLLAAAVSLGLAGLYVRSRTREFQIETAGDDPVLLPPQERGRAVADRLRAAIGGEPRDQ